MDKKSHKFLQNKSVAVTPVRQLVLEMFFAEKRALSLQDLEQLLPRTDRSTIYRTLKTFVKKGVFHSLDDGSGRTTYALCQEECGAQAHLDLHPHFKCIRCEKMVCINSVKLTLPSFPANYEIHDFKALATGICSNCR